MAILARHRSAPPSRCSYGDPTMTDDITHYDAVEAYCDALSCRPGDELALHVSCRADRYDIEIHRWGAERELVWAAADLAGEEQATPPDADANGCGWTVSVDVPIGDDWRSGFYLVTLHEPRTRRRIAPSATPASSSDAGRASRSRVAGDRDEHVQRLQRLGRPQPVHRRERGVVPPAYGRGMIVRDDVERDDRKARPCRFREEPDVEGRSTRSTASATDIRGT